MGGVEPRYDVSNNKGVLANMTNSDRGREGVKNPENLADVICTCPLKDLNPDGQVFEGVQGEETQMNKIHQ